MDEVCSCTALRQAARHVTQFYDAALKPAGVGLNQFSILAKLHHVGPVAIQDLARHLVMDRSTLGHLLRPLMRRRLVTLTVDSHDRRSRRLALSAAGRVVLAKARPHWVEAEGRFASAMGGGDVARDLRRTLKSVATTDLNL
jgi:DNA-binding MarR family transcriptional regulator